MSSLASVAIVDAAAGPVIVSASMRSLLPPLPPPDERAGFLSVLPPSITPLISDLAEIGVADEGETGAGWRDPTTGGTGRELVAIRSRFSPDPAGGGGSAPIRRNG